MKQTRDEHPELREDQDTPIWKALTAEFIGTFFLTFVSAAPIVIGELTGKLHNIDKVLPAGMVVAALIYTIGAISGAHFNPAVTLAFTLRRAFPWRNLPLYWVTQLVAATAAGATVIAMFGLTAHAGANEPHLGMLPCLVMEVLFTFLLCSVILGTSTQHRSIGPNAALAVGLTIALCGLVGGPVSGASMNPARSLGPAIVGGSLDTAWIYVVGPLVGGALAALVATILHGPANGAEISEAEGKRRKDVATSRR